LFRAGISPTVPASDLTAAQVRLLWSAIRKVLLEAIRFGSTVPLSYEPADSSNMVRSRGDTLAENRNEKLFYFGTAPDAADFYEERLRVYDRAGRPCGTCGAMIQRIFQGGRSTFFCDKCQK
jgi:formamidopyrimidine-DNA glycosylase